MARLVIEKQGQAPRVFELPVERTIKIGRADSNDLILRDTNVSRLHATLTAEDGKWKLEDRQSANGVQVNGAFVTEAMLKAGDVLSIGDHTLRFEQAETRDLRTHAGTDLPSRLTLVMSRKEVELALREAGGAPTPWSQATPADTAALPERRRSADERLRSLEHENRLLTLLYQVSRALGELATVEDVAEKVLEMVLQIEGVERGYAMLRNEKGELQPAVVRYRRLKESANAPQMILSQSIIRSVLDGKEPVLVQDASADARFSSSQSLVLSGMQSAMCAPLRSPASTAGAFGLLYVDNLSKRGMFTQDDLNVFAVIAAQAGLAIDHVRAKKEVAQQIIHLNTLERFLSPGIARKVAGELGQIQVGGENQKVTVLFADIRGFTSLAEGMTPEGVVDMLNRYFSAMTETIFEHGGTLDKYLGDGLMTLFGAPFAREDDAFQAVRAAIEMQRSLAELNRGSGRAPLRMGIGINTGPVIVGYMGASRRLDYTAIGDTVNTASRLTALAEPDQILVSAATQAELAAAEFAARALPPVRVKGKAAPVEIFEIPWK